MEILDVAVPVVLAALAVAAICRKSNGEKRGGAAPPRDTGKYPVATPEAAEAFFRDAGNFSRLSVDDILDILGRPADYDDWDLGRLVYTWRNADRCLRIYTQGASLQAVVLMAPVDTPRFGAPLEVIWEK
jgi:hypothetical protein